MRRARAVRRGRKASNSSVFGRRSGAAGSPGRPAPRRRVAPARGSARARPPRRRVGSAAGGRCADAVPAREQRAQRRRERRRRAGEEAVEEGVELGARARRRAAGRAARRTARRPRCARTSESSPRTKLRSQDQSRWSKSACAQQRQQHGAQRAARSVGAERGRDLRRRGAGRQPAAGSASSASASSSVGSAGVGVAEQADRRARRRRGAMPLRAQPGVAVERRARARSRPGSRSRPPVRGVKPG